MATASPTTAIRSSRSVGRRRDWASSRESESRSVTSRFVLAVSCAIRDRKRSRATASSRARPCSVSMKPITAVSGVFSSWLTLATKSRRIDSLARASETSRNTRSTRGRAPASDGSGVTATSNGVSTSPVECTNRAVPGRLPAKASSTGPSRAGCRRTLTWDCPIIQTPSRSRAAPFAISTRPPGSSRSAGSSSASSSAAITGAEA